jgi:hypothetical protein
MPASQCQNSEEEPRTRLFLIHKSPSDDTETEHTRYHKHRIIPHMQVN